MFFLFIGQIKPPTNGTSLTFCPGSTVKIDWSYADALSQIQLRFWFFNSSDGSRLGQLTAIYLNGEPEPLNSSLIPRFEIEKPATLVLKNVDRAYNGIYTFVLYTKSRPVPYKSQVVVVIAGTDI